MTTDKFQIPFKLSLFHCMKYYACVHNKKHNHELFAMVIIVDDSDEARYMALQIG
jgi:hypothetical protein